MRKRGIRARWAVPAGIVAAVGVVIAASAVASAAATPSLPARTAAQLLAAVAADSSKPLGPLTATVQVTSSLGLPQLPSALQQEGSGTGLLGGTQSARIWYRDPQHVRVALPAQAGETDYRLDGRTLWAWSSKTQMATRLALPAHFTGLNGNVADLPGGLLTGPAGQQTGPAATLPDSPLAAANQVLKAVGPTTVVSVQRNLYVAGRAAYQLALVPKSGQSLVGKVLIAIDASRHIPLRVQVFGRGSSSLAYGIGFTSLSFGTPAASNFSFTPPRGATVKRETVPGNPGALLPKSALGAVLPGASAVPAGVVKPPPGIALSGGTTKLPKAALARLKARFAKSLPATMSKAERAAAIKSFDAAIQSKASQSNASRLLHLPKPAAARPQAGAPRVIGTSWLSVVATPASPQVAAVVRELLSTHSPASASPDGSSAVQYSSGSGGAYSSTMTMTSGNPVPAGQGAAILRDLLTATRAVHGSWGSGRLLQTKLLTVLITSNGRILAGAVTPAVLYRDVALDAG
jgi:hypothetical protein